MKKRNKMTLGITMVSVAAQLFNGFMGYRVSKEPMPFMSFTSSKPSKRYRVTGGHPHIGKKQKARMRRQIASGFIKLGKGGLLHIN